MYSDYTVGKLAEWKLTCQRDWAPELARYLDKVPVLVKIYAVLDGDKTKNYVYFDRDCPLFPL